MFTAIFFGTIFGVIWSFVIPNPPQSFYKPSKTDDELWWDINVEDPEDCKPDNKFR